MLGEAAQRRDGRHNVPATQTRKLWYTWSLASQILCQRTEEMWMTEGRKENRRVADVARLTEGKAQGIDSSDAKSPGGGCTANTIPSAGLFASVRLAQCVLRLRTPAVT